MADIATQILLTYERRLTSMEHRLDALEKSAQERRKPDRVPTEWLGMFLHPRLWWPLLVVGLGAATQQITLQQAIGTMLSLVVK